MARSQKQIQALNRAPHALRNGLHVDLCGHVGLRMAQVGLDIFDTAPTLHMGSARSPQGLVGQFFQESFRNVLTQLLQSTSGPARQPSEARASKSCWRRSGCRAATSKQTGRTGDAYRTCPRSRNPVPSRAIAAATRTHCSNPSSAPQCRRSVKWIRQCEPDSIRRGRRGAGRTTHPGEAQAPATHKPKPA
jgi:hypothetical protein